MNGQELKEALRQFISTNGLWGALGMLQEICQEEAQRSRDDWNEIQAQQWWKADRIIGKATVTIPNRPEE